MSGAMGSLASLIVDTSVEVHEKVVEIGESRVLAVEVPTQEQDQWC